MNNRITHLTLPDLHASLCERALDILKRKSHDYTQAGTDPFSNFRAAERRGVKMELGLLLRVDDKLARIQTFIEKGTLLVQDESFDDAVMDIINYMVLLKGMVEERKQKGGEKDAGEKSE
jgi:hypothetical protein